MYEEPYKTVVSVIRERGGLNENIINYEKLQAIRSKLQKTFCLYYISFI